METFLGLFGGLGAIVVWETFLKRWADRRQAARILAAEIRWYVEYLYEIIEVRTRAPEVIPMDRPSTHPGFGAVGLTVGTLPTDVLVNVLEFYRSLDTIAGITQRFAIANAPDRRLLVDLDEMISSLVVSGSALLERLERLGGGRRLSLRVDEGRRKGIAALAEAYVKKGRRGINP